jgi:hypothetical protein
MPTYFARKAGNINATDVWATAPGGTASAVTFASGDVLVSNSFAIAINVSTDLGGSGQLRNDTLGGATAGGTFTLAAGLTLTANILQNNVTGGVTVVTCTFSAPLSASIVGNVTSPVNTSGSSRPVSLTGNGTLNFTGNATGDMKSSSTGGAIGNVGGGTINFVGTATGGGGTAGYALENASSGTINITGNCLGAVAPAVGNTSTGTINITGQALGTTTTGGGAGVANTSTGAVFATRAVGGSFGPGSSGVTAAPGIANSSTGIVEIEQLQYGTLGMSPTSGGGIRLKKLGSNVAVFNYCDTAGAKTLIDATQNAAMPAEENVRSGVSYASGALTGTCAVPEANSVAWGVPIRNTTGTAALTPAAVWEYATRTITGGTVTTLTNSPDVPTEAEIATAVWGASTKEITGGTVTNLTNAPASVTPADIWDYNDRTLTSASGPTAVEIRQEIDANSSKLDVAISSRLADADYVEPANSDVAAIKAKTDALPSDPADQSLLEAAIAGVTAPSAATVASAVRSELSSELSKVSALNTERLANVATTAIVGNLIAQANS